MNELLQATPHIRAQQGQLMVIKIGGACLARPRWVQTLAKQIATVQALGAQVVVVHGGGPQANKMQAVLGEEARLVGGRRVTTATAMRALRMTVAGEVNADLAAALTAAGAPAVGLHAGSANLVQAHRRAPMMTAEGEVDFGAVGDIDSVNAKPFNALMKSGMIPVVCPPVGDGSGGFLNVNADLMAAEIAVALGAKKLLLLTSVAGILQGQGVDQAVVSTLDLHELENLQQNGDLQDGMLVKKVAIARALSGGVEQVHVLSGFDPEALLIELYTNHGAGTLVTADEGAVLC
ncbi:MAG: acetylglutamate kinase [Planctomycetes bacterium]|nr:acetylglutamate kinase [Planctomycetota bacterium]